MPTKTHPPGFITAGLPELVSRMPVMTYNPNRPPPAATAPPAVDGEQADRDFFWNELLLACRERRCSPTRQSWLLAESGRSEADLAAELGE